MAQVQLVRMLFGALYYVYIDGAGFNTSLRRPQDWSLKEQATLFKVLTARSEKPSYSTLALTKLKEKKAGERKTIRSER